MQPRRSFTSDNSATVHPTVMAALERANHGHANAYGDDAWTREADESLRAVFGERARPLLVFGGTAANVLALRPFVDSFQAVLCAASSHLWRDECAAPERFLGAKLIPIASADGKLTPELLRPALQDRGVVHHAQPRAVSVAQPTEWGTLYAVDELRALAEFAHQHDMILHVDGARLANAAAALELPLASLAGDAGADVVCFGATKLGAMAAEAVIYFDDEAAARAAFHRKQGMQLASKMRFIAAQLHALLADELWRSLASHANAMAARLGAGLAELPGVALAHPVQTNGVFAQLPAQAIAPLQQHSHFHLWDPARSLGRLMTAWDTPADHVDAFVATARSLLSAP